MKLRLSVRSCDLQRMHVLFALILALTLTGVADSSADDAVNVPPAIDGKGYQLVKNWDFGRTVTKVSDLRSEFYTRYTSSHGTKDHLGNEWEVYRDNDNHEISDGSLHLIARVPSGTLKQGYVESGMISSKWRGKYGYFEAKMKVPKGRGLWPAFWFANEYWPPEIDVLETINNGQDTTNSSFHAVHGKFVGKTIFSQLHKNQAYVPGFDYADGFHTFAIEWTPTTVAHYVDDKLVVEREFQWRHDNGSEGEQSPVVLNLAVGGDWPGPPQSLSEFPASLDVQYIRVWQQ